LKSFFSGYDQPVERRVPTSRATGHQSEEAEKANMQAMEAVVLLEQARALLAEDNAVQLAMQHIDEVISEAESGAAMLEDWYLRTYSPEDSSTY
jgi:hypothetical protein